MHGQGDCAVTHCSVVIDMVACVRGSSYIGGVPIVVLSYRGGKCVRSVL